MIFGSVRMLREPTSDDGTITLVLVASLGLGTCQPVRQRCEHRDGGRVLPAREAGGRPPREPLGEPAARGDRPRRRSESSVHAAPTEIRDDVQLLADSYEQVANSNYASLASRAVKLQAAGQHLAKYTLDNCHFDINGS